MKSYGYLSRYVVHSWRVVSFEFKYLSENATVSAQDLLDKAQEQILTQRYAAIADTKVRAFALVYSQKEKQLCLMSEVKL
ncbi:MAG: hypothetical protein PUB79_06360 [Succinivibrio sp.]|nr:hypothetical protein [Succinivibrio sp.]